VLVGITGHQRLDRPEGWHEVERRLRDLLVGLKLPLIGISSLAAGADQLFAELILELGGELSVILPFRGYDRTFQDPIARGTYQRLLKQATRLETLDCRGSDEDCFLAAGQRLVNESDLLVAVWDGRPSLGKGGTADIVEYATSTGRQTVLIDVAAWR
jgi:hypothetical protein